MYKLTYDNGKAVLLDTNNREVVEYAARDERARTGMNIIISPWYAFPVRSELTFLCSVYYSIHRGRWVDLYEVPANDDYSQEG